MAPERRCDRDAAPSSWRRRRTPSPNDKGPAASATSGVPRTADGAAHRAKLDRMPAAPLAGARASYAAPPRRWRTTSIPIPTCTHRSCQRPTGAPWKRRVAAHHDDGAAEPTGDTKRAGCQSQRASAGQAGDRSPSLSDCTATVRRWQVRVQRRALLALLPAQDAPVQRTPLSGVKGECIVAGGGGERAARSAPRRSGA